MGAGLSHEIRLLIYQPHPFNPKAFSSEQYASIAQGYAEVTHTENVTPGLPLGLPKDAVTVRIRDGEIETVNRPYVDEAGAVGGFSLLIGRTKAGPSSISWNRVGSRLYRSLSRTMSELRNGN